MTWEGKAVFCDIGPDTAVMSLGLGCQQHPSQSRYKCKAKDWRAGQESTGFRVTGGPSLLIWALVSLHLHHFPTIGCLMVAKNYPLSSALQERETSHHPLAL